MSHYTKGSFGILNFFAGTSRKLGGAWRILNFLNRQAACVFHAAPLPDQRSRFLRLRIGVAIFVTGGFDGASVDVVEAGDGRPLLPVLISGAGGETRGVVVELYRRGWRFEGIGRFLLVFAEQVWWVFMEEGSESCVGFSWSCFV